MNFTSIINRSRQHSREFKINRRKQLFSVINPLQQYGAIPRRESLAYDGKQTAESMRSSYDDPIKGRPYTTDAGV